jgi:hypothetical protein
MRIGLLYEGMLDKEPAQELIKSILREQGKDGQHEFVCYPCGGPIVSFMEPAHALFFDSIKPCDIAVFLSDSDRDGKKCLAVDRRKKEYSNSMTVDTIAVGCPDPCFENWLLIEEVAVKKVLFLAGDKPLPHSDLKPKPRLAKLIRENNKDITKTSLEIYTDIAKKVNIGALYYKDPTFKDLCDQIKEISKPF